MHKPSESLNHLGFRPEINRGFTIRAENFLVFFRMLRKHASAHCGRFKCAHGMPVAIGAANQTERHLRSCDGSAEDQGIGMPETVVAGLRVALPESAIQRDAKAVSNQRADQGNPIRVRASGENHVRRVLHAQGWIIEVQRRGVRERQIRYGSAAMFL
jgi:hypothetical protein